LFVLSAFFDYYIYNYDPMKHQVKMVSNQDWI
jgi:hypothetical protein